MLAHKERKILINSLKKDYTDTLLCFDSGNMSRSDFIKKMDLLSSEIVTIINLKMIDNELGDFLRSILKSIKTDRNVK